MDPSVCWALVHCDTEGVPGLAGLGFTHCAVGTRGPPSLHLGEEHGALICFIIPPRETSPGAALWGNFLRLKVGCPI